MFSSVQHTSLLLRLMIHEYSTYIHKLEYLRYRNIEHLLWHRERRKVMRCHAFAHRAFRLVVKSVVNKPCCLLAKMNRVIHFSQQQGYFTTDLTTSRKALWLETFSIQVIYRDPFILVLYKRQAIPKVQDRVCVCFTQNIFNVTGKGEKSCVQRMLKSSTHGFITSSHDFKISL